MVDMLDPNGCRLRGYLEKRVLAVGSCKVSDQDCRMAFLNWVAYVKELSPDVRQDHLTCPMVDCQQDGFQNMKAFLGHVSTCDLLPAAHYWCPFCCRGEHFGASDLPADFFILRQRAKDCLLKRAYDFFKRFGRIRHKEYPSKHSGRTRQGYYLSQFEELPAIPAWPVRRSTQEKLQELDLWTNDDRFGLVKNRSSHSSIPQSNGSQRKFRHELHVSTAEQRSEMSSPAPSYEMYSPEPSYDRRSIVLEGVIPESGDLIPWSHPRLGSRRSASDRISIASSTNRPSHDREDSGDPVSTYKAVHPSHLRQDCNETFVTLHHNPSQRTDSDPTVSPIGANALIQRPKFQRMSSHEVQARSFETRVESNPTPFVGKKPVPRRRDSCHLSTQLGSMSPDRGIDEGINECSGSSANLSPTLDDGSATYSQPYNRHSTASNVKRPISESDELVLDLGEFPWVEECEDFLHHSGSSEHQMASAACDEAVAPASGLCTNPWLGCSFLHTDNGTQAVIHHRTHVRHSGVVNAATQVENLLQMICMLNGFWRNDLKSRPELEAPLLELPFEAGLKALKDCLKGEIPTSLSEVFALIQLGYGCAFICHNDNESFTWDDFFHNVLGWREAISSQSDRLIFSYISERLRWVPHMSTDTNSSRASTLATHSRQILVSRSQELEPVENVPLSDLCSMLRDGPVVQCCVHFLDGK